MSGRAGAALPCRLNGGTDGTWPGEGGMLDAGEGASTIHIRWERVAQSFATVCARVLNGVTWKTGKESLPSVMPRSERMTEMKWMHEDVSSGIEEVSVRSYREMESVQSAYPSISSKSIPSHRRG